MIWLLPEKTLPRRGLSSTKVAVSGTLPQTNMEPNHVVFIEHLEGHGDVVTRLILGIIGVTIWVQGVINLLTKSP